MQFALTTFLFAALASTRVLAAPSSIIPQANGASLQLTGHGTIQRLAADGAILGESPVSASDLEKFNGLAVQSQRRDNILVQRGCLIGHACTSDADCYFNGCSGCLFLRAGAGVCYGSIS